MTIENPHDVLHTVNLITQCLCIPIITIFVVMRFSIRVWFKQFLPVEDTFCLLAWLLFMAYCVIAIFVGKYGGGYHYTDVSDANLVLYRKFCYIATALYCPMALFTKIALLSILIRIFQPYKYRIMFIYGLLAALSIYYIIAEIVKIRICDPIPSYWLLTPGASCLDQRAALIADSVISVVTDLVILILPLPLTWSLQMSRNKKLRVIGILSAGGLATGFSIYRLILVLREGSSPDMTMVFICVILSGNAEGGMGLICACLPTLNILISRLRSANNSYNSNHYYQEGSGVQLGKLKGSNGKGFSAIGSKSSKSDIGNEFGSDQSQLISYADAGDVGSGGRAGIHRTVDVSQTVEMLPEERRQTRF